MTPLDLTDTLVYDFHAPAAAGAGRENPKHVRRTSAINGVFLRLQFINGGRCEGNRKVGRRPNWPVSHTSHSSAALAVRSESADSTQLGASL